MSERLQKVLARSGLGSRRYCEDLIRTGRVRVNERVANLGDKVVVDSDEITVDGAPLRLPARNRYIKLHKPAGYLSSSRSQGGHPTIFALVSIPERVYAVGRLDLASEGLMILTDDGDLTHRLTHPRYQHEKEYRVLFDEKPSEEQIDRWHRGFELPDGYRTQTSELEIEKEEDGHCWCRIILREGHKRQIRTMASVLGLSVLRLIRVRIASLRLGDLAPGAWQDCTNEEINSLVEASQLSYN